jgi:hypothetical protein
MKNCSDLDFLNSYWKELHKIVDKIQKELPITIGKNYDSEIKVGNNALFFTIKNSDLKDNWSPRNLTGYSESLKALADKLEHMILYKGNADSVKLMITKIASGRIKKLTKKNNSYKGQKGDFLGYGHFRFNNRAYTLNKFELFRIRQFFEL